MCVNERPKLLKLLIHSFLCLLKNLTRSCRFCMKQQLFVRRWVRNAIALILASRYAKLFTTQSHNRAMRAKALLAPKQNLRKP